MGKGEEDSGGGGAGMPTASPSVDLEPTVTDEAKGALRRWEAGANTIVLLFPLRLFTSSMAGW